MELMETLDFIKEKWDEYGIKFTCDDIPGGKQLGLEYRGGEFKVRLIDNKFEGLTIDWSLVKNEEVAKELQQMLEGDLDKSKLDTPIYLSDDEANDIVGSDESGKGDLFGGIVVAAAYIHPDDLDEVRKLGVKDSKELSDDACFEIVRALETHHDSQEKIYDHGLMTSITPGQMRAQIVVAHVNPIMYNNKLGGIDKTPEDLLERLHHMVVTRVCHDNLEFKSEKVVVVIDQFKPTMNTDEDWRPDGDDVKYTMVVEARPHAESKVLAVALASVFARVYFLRQIEELSLQLDKKIPLGNGKTAKKFYEKNFAGLADEDIAKYMKLKY